MSGNTDDIGKALDLTRRIMEDCVSMKEILIDYEGKYADILGSYVSDVARRTISTYRELLVAMEEQWDAAETGTRPSPSQPGEGEE